MARRVTTRIVKIKDALDALGISKNTYVRKWRNVFTDARDPADRRKRCVLRVYEDELSIAVEQGREAVLTYRVLMKRIPEENAL